MKDITKEAAEGGLNLTYGSLKYIGPTNYGTIISYMVDDGKWAVGSMVVVFAYLCFNLRSGFLATAGFFQIVVSVPVSFAMFACLGYRYVGERDEAK